MKKNFLSCFFLAAFLWGQTAPVMANPQTRINDWELIQRERLAQDALLQVEGLQPDREDDTFRKPTFCQQYKKVIVISTAAAALLTVGTGIGIGIGIGTGTGIASALGGFSPDNSAFTLQPILSTDQARQIIRRDGNHVSALLETRNPNNYEKCPDGTYPGADNIILDLPAKIIAIGSSFLSGCAELFVQKVRGIGIYHKCQGYRPFRIPAWATCPDKESDSPLLYGLESEFEGTGYAAGNKMGYEKLVDYLKENNYPFTHGMRIRDPSGNTVIVNANFDGELFAYGCFRKSPEDIGRPCAPGTKQRGVHKFDESWEKRFSKKIQNGGKINPIDRIVQLGTRGLAYRCDSVSEQPEETIQTVIIDRDLSSFFKNPYTDRNRLQENELKIIRDLEESYQKSNPGKHQAQQSYDSCYCVSDRDNGIEKCSPSIFVKGIFASCLDRLYTCKSDNLFFIQNLYYRCINGALYLKDSLLQKSMNGGSSGLLSYHAQNNGLSKECPVGLFKGIMSMFYGDEPGTTESLFCNQAFSNKVSWKYGRSGKFYCNNNGYVADCGKWDPCGSAGGRLKMSGTFGTPKQCWGGGELCLEGLEYTCDRIRF